MGWKHPSVGLSALVDQVGAFLDMLILASGYKSDGSPAEWDAQTLRKALGWASYFEQVLQDLPPGKEGQDSAVAFDSALDALLGVVPLPPGMPKLSFSMLGNARGLLLQQLVQSLPIRNSWVVAKVVDADEGESGELWEAVIDAMAQRCLAFGSVRHLQQALDEAVRPCRPGDMKAEIWDRQSSLPFGVTGVIRAPYPEWAAKCLRYVTSAETIHKFSGASLIFGGHPSEWVQVLDSLQNWARPDRMCSVKTEIAELCCLYLASPLWKGLPRILLHATCTSSKDETSTFTKRYMDCWVGKTPFEVGGGQDVARDEVESYLLRTVNSGTEWWNLPPILVAAALANSPALETYVQLLRSRIDDSKLLICSSDRRCQHCALQSDSRERAWCSWILQDRGHEIELSRLLFEML